MATKNSINNATQDLTVDPGAGADSFVQFAIGAAKDFRIGVDDTDGFYKIAEGNALGTNDTFEMTDAGERTLPLNPAFLVFISADATNVTGNNTTYTVANNTEVFDIGGNYDTSTFTFTAPITGKYFFNTYIVVDDLNSSMDVYLLRIPTSNVILSGPVYINSTGAVPEGLQGRQFSVITAMDAADTVTTDVRVGGSTLTVDVIGGASATSTRFAGVLIT